MKDNVIPKSKWEFDADVTAAFDDMLRRSIPQYDVMRKACENLASRFIQERTDVVDLGCSRGESLMPLVKRFAGSKVRFHGLEISEPMLQASRERFASEIKMGFVNISKHDLRLNLPTFTSSLTLSVLTLQFVPIEHRQRIIQNVWNTTLPGGAFILVEKILGETSPINEMMVSEYHAMKKQNGYSEEDIDRKRLSLEGVLVPVTARWNEDLLRQAGFKAVDCFWRWMNFAAWVAIKG